MNIEPHNLIDPLREKLPHLIRHEKLYRMIHRQLMKNGFNILCCSLSSVPSVPSYTALSRNQLPTIISCMHSTTWPPLYSPSNMDCASWLLPCNMPVATMPGKHVCATCSPFMDYPVHGDLCVQGNPARTSCSAGLRTDYLQADTLFTFLPDDWHRTPDRQRRTCYGLYRLWHHVGIFRYSDVLHRTLRTTASL